MNNEEFESIKKKASDAVEESIDYDDDSAISFVVYELPKLMDEIECLKTENEQLRAQISDLCPIADLSTIETLQTEKRILMEELDDERIGRTLLAKATDRIRELELQIAKAEDMCKKFCLATEPDPDKATEFDKSDKDRLVIEADYEKYYEQRYIEVWIKTYGSERDALNAIFAKLLELRTWVYEQGMCPECLGDLDTKEVIEEKIHSFCEVCLDCGRKWTHSNLSFPNS